MFAGTGGDRLIDWVGVHNSYYVPFTPYGAPTITRTLEPGLAKFLYALSKSDGADQVLGLRYGGEASRNGEPFGELGLVLPQDGAWQQQSGPPFNPMPENLSKVADRRRSRARTSGRSIRPGTIASSVGDALILPAAGVDSTNETAVPLLVTATPGQTRHLPRERGHERAFRQRARRRRRKLRGRPEPLELQGRLDHRRRDRERRRSDPPKTLTGTLTKSTAPPPAPKIVDPLPRLPGQRGANTSHHRQAWRARCWMS